MFVLSPSNGLVCSCKSEKDISFNTPNVAKEGMEMVCVKF